MYLCIDVETSKSPKHFPWIYGSYLSMVGIYTSEGKSYSWIFNHNHIGIKPHVRLIKEIQHIIGKADLCIMHNQKFDTHWLSTIGIELKETWDTMIVEYLLEGQNNRLSYSLDESCKRRGLETKLSPVKTYWDSGIDTKDIPIETLIPYCIQDCKVTLQLYEEQVKQIPKKMERLVKLQNAFVGCLNEIEANGMVVDVPYLKEQTEIYTKLQEELDAKLSLFIMDAIPELHNIPYMFTSNDHLSCILYGGTLKYDSTEYVTRYYVKAPPKTYERACVKDITINGLKFQPIKGSETKKDGYFKTNKDIQLQLKGKSKAQKEFLRIIEEKSRVDKILSTYLIGMEKHIYKDNTIHPSFNQALTVTGRLSSNSPNFQNLPRGTTDEVSKRIFIPRDSNRLILNGDLSALEWCVGAQLSNDEIMIQEISDGVDIHTANSLAVFGTESMRQEAKVVSFRSLYCGSPYSFFMDSKMPQKSLKEWEDISERFYNKYSGLGRWQNENYKTVCKYGELSEFTGRRWIFHKEADSHGVLKYNKSAVGNYPVQGVATGDLVPFAMMVIRKKIKDENLDCLMICQVHDSIVFDVHKSSVDRLAEIVWLTFNDLPRLVNQYFKYSWRVKLTGEIEVGRNYKDLQKIFDKKGRIINCLDLF